LLQTDCRTKGQLFFNELKFGGCFGGCSTRFCRNNCSEPSPEILRSAKHIHILGQKLVDFAKSGEAPVAVLVAVGFRLLCIFLQNTATDVSLTRP
jgi:hypothetical protein